MRIPLLERGAGHDRNLAVSGRAAKSYVKRAARATIVGLNRLAARPKQAQPKPREPHP
jgi:hypothetical protein